MISHNACPPAGLPGPVRGQVLVVHVPWACQREPWAHALDALWGGRSVWGQSGYWVLEGRCDKRPWSHSAQTGYEYIRVLCELFWVCEFALCVLCMHRTCCGSAAAQQQSHQPIPGVERSHTCLQTPLSLSSSWEPRTLRVHRPRNSVVRLAAAWGAACGPLYLCIELVVRAFSAPSEVWCPRG